MTSAFIHRPVLAIVVSLLITLIGLLSLNQLPVAQFPEIAPPEVNVTTKYVGANAEVCVKAVVTTLERAINGVPGMSYMFSVSGNDGTSVIQIIFKPGTDPEIASVNVQNRVTTVLDELPEEVVKAGVEIEKVQNSMLLYVNILSTDPNLDEKFLYNFADITALKELKRIDGVGFADIMGQREYAMRIWLRPDQLLMYNISPLEVIERLKAQNVEAAPGKIGESSGREPQALQYVLKYTGKYSTKDAYENIVLKSKEDGEILRLKDVADVEFDSQDYDVLSRENGRPSAAIILKQRPGTNAKEVIENIKQTMDEIKKTSFPPGMDYTISYDVSEFLDASIHEVIKTLAEAFLLVALVVFVFLQDFRSTIIPILAVPVSLVGTFFVMRIMGFSINLVTLFALVLAIGIVVDNAIVVVEAVHTKMHLDKLGVLEATEATMKELSGAIVTMTLVMAAVFLPGAFLEGPEGIFYREFSLTMAAAIVLSGVTALTLTPALCGLLLDNQRDHAAYHSSYLQGFFTAFNSGYESTKNAYTKVVQLLTDRRVLMFGMLIGFSVGIAILGARLPTGFIPQEDQGTIYANVTTSSGATLERTDKVVEEIQKIASGLESVRSVSSLAGYSVLSEGYGSVYGMNLISLRNWSDRTVSDKEVIDVLTAKTQHIKDARVEYFTPPPVPGYGNASGFEMRLLDRTSSGSLEQLQKLTDLFVKHLNERPEIASAYTTLNTRFPQFLLHIDGDRAAQKGVTVENVMHTLQSLLGSEYATNFIRFGQMYRVMVQALPKFRAQPEDLLKLYVKNDAGKMVPVSSFLYFEKIYGPEQVTRYNMYTAAMINGQAAPGYSSGQAIDAVREVASQYLPKGYSYDWAGPSREEAQAGHQALFLFIVSLAFVYLLLAAQYESFLLPMPVILSLPTGVFGSFLFLTLGGLESSIYAKIAMIMLIGMLGKNAILIVEYAAQRMRAGLPPRTAVIEAAELRLRPILMTSLAFVAGLIPLMLASGAGEIGNNTIGSATAGGMIFGTVFGSMIIPSLFTIFARQDRSHRRRST